MKQFFKANWILLLILLLGLFMRFWQIGNLPGGLFPDEAANGLDINSILQGQVQPFYERGNGREALFFYFEALSVILFGRGVWQFHIVSAAFGLAAVAATYFLTKRMFGKRPALLATFLMAVSSFAVTISRTAFRANTVPLFSILCILFIVKFFQGSDKKEKYWSAFWAGIFFGLGLYTYTSFRMMVPLLMGLGMLLFLANRQNVKEIIRIYTKFKAMFALGFFIAFSWLGMYFIQHPGSFVGRAGQVSIFNQNLNSGDLLGTFFEVFKKTILSFFTQGDLNWRHNISGFPLLTPLVSPVFAIGLIICSYAIFRLLKQAYEQKIEEQAVYQALVASWFWLMLVPEITTAEGIPHGLRLIGTIPPLFLLSAWGANWLWERMPGAANANFLKAEKFFVSSVFILTVLIYNYALYFGIAAGSSDYYYAFRSDLTTVSNYLNKRNQKSHTYLSLDKFSVQTVEYLTTDKNQPYLLIDPARTFEVNLTKGDQVIFTMSTLFDRLKFLEYNPDAKLVRTNKNQFGQIIMLVYEKE